MKNHSATESKKSSKRSKCNAEQSAPYVPSLEDIDRQLESIATAPDAYRSFVIAHALDALIVASRALNVRHARFLELTQPQPSEPSSPAESPQ
jgi:hypothetical protein